MREIKFRAWDGEEMKPLFVINSETGEIIYNGQIKKWPIMQYTGLKDKNGKEIYEGDIVGFNKPLPNWRVGEESIHEVKWLWSGWFPFNDYDSDCEVYINDPDQGYEYEIIGNIYENRELLK